MIAGSCSWSGTPPSRSSTATAHQPSLRGGRAVGFVVGFALFGAVTYLPLFLQVVKGSSPTSSACS